MPVSNGPASVVGSSVAVWSGDVVYVDVMMRLWTIKIMLQVVGARAYLKPLVISQLHGFGRCDQLSWFWPFVVKFKNH